HGIERDYAGGRIEKRSAVEHAAPDAAAQAADCLSAIKRPTQGEPAIQGNAPIQHGGITIDVAPIAVIFATIVAGSSDGEGVPEHGMRVGDASRISRLPKALARLRRAIPRVGIIRRLAGEIVEN